MIGTHVNAILQQWGLPQTVQCRGPWSACKLQECIIGGHCGWSSAGGPHTPCKPKDCISGGHHRWSSTGGPIAHMSPRMTSVVLPPTVCHRGPGAHVKPRTVSVRAAMHGPAQGPAVLWSGQFFLKWSGFICCDLPKWC